MNKRVELHAHTNMSTMDGVCTACEYIDEAIAQGMSAIAITDHGVVQAFPEAFKEANWKGNIKLIYGMEGYFVDDKEQIVFGNSKEGLDGTFVIVDIETTGLNPQSDQIIEIAACRVKERKIVDEFTTLVNPGVEIDKEIEELTGITNEMIKDSPNISVALKQFLEFCKEDILVAHNAKFDMGFISKSLRDNYFDFMPDYIDTLALSRFLFPEMQCHKLSVLCRELEIENESQHRALGDANATAKMFIKFTEELDKKQIHDISEIDVRNDVPYYKGRSRHITIIVENEIGLKNLYKLVTKSHTEHFYKKPIILRSELQKYREGLLYGSACSEGEIYSAILDGKNDEELDKISDFYNFLEVQPIENNRYLIEQGKIKNDEALRDVNKRIVALGERNAKMVIATSDAHYVKTEDKETRQILLSHKGYEDYNKGPNLHMRTTEEMLDEFSYLGEGKAHEIVIRTPNCIADLIKPFPPMTYGEVYPVIDGAEEKLCSIATEKAKELYGTNPPEIIKERLEWELNAICENKYATQYIIAKAIVDKSKSSGYIVGNRGMVGSSLVAFLLGITEINPLPPHYYCTDCDYIEFNEDEFCGADMARKICPKCGAELNRDGYNIPVEMFMGIDGTKEPDIDLNLAENVREECAKTLCELFGDDHIIRAGTISTYAEKTAESIYKEYCEKTNKNHSKDEKKNILNKLTSVKRTTGLHPGGEIIIPQCKEIFDYTPIQYPANNIASGIYTTHFNYHELSRYLLKLDILIHDTMTILKRLEDATGLKPKDIPVDDKETFDYINSPDVNDVPEFSTEFVKEKLVSVIKPKCMDDLIRISGISHGTGTWLDNAENLIQDIDITDLISCRDDVMLFLQKNGYEKEEAYKIAERVRKGKQLTEEQYQSMLDNPKIPDWYPESCNRILYSFPRAHAAVYALNAYRIAYYKTHYPLEF